MRHECNRCKEKGIVAMDLCEECYWEALLDVGEEAKVVYASYGREFECCDDNCGEC